MPSLSWLDDGAWFTPTPAGPSWLIASSGSVAAIAAQSLRLVPPGQVPASAGNSAARPGSCRMPPGALYVESGKGYVPSFPLHGRPTARLSATVRKSRHPGPLMHSRGGGAVAVPNPRWEAPSPGFSTIAANAGRRGIGPIRPVLCSRRCTARGITSARRIGAAGMPGCVDPS